MAITDEDTIDALERCIAGFDELIATVGQMRSLAMSNYEAAVSSLSSFDVVMSKYEKSLVKCRAALFAAANPGKQEQHEQQSLN
jgi:hypothetical protein